MKIFEIIHDDGEKEWVSGETNIEALQTYCSITSCDLVQMDGSKIIELPKYKWAKYKVIDEDGEMSFRQWMKENNKSDIIAGTFYEI